MANRSYGVALTASHMVHIAYEHNVTILDLSSQLATLKREIRGWVMRSSQDATAAMILAEENVVMANANQELRVQAHTRGGSVCGRGGVCCRFWRWPSVGRAHAHPNQPWPPPTVTLSYSSTTSARLVLRLPQLDRRSPSQSTCVPHPTTTKNVPVAAMQSATGTTLP
jgi:hypothetical protein